MKRTAFIIYLLLVFIGSESWAQGKRPQNQLTPTERAEKATLRMKAKLNLSEEQAAQVKAVFIKRSATEQSNREELKKQREATDKELSGILSPEQMDKYMQMKEERRNKMMEKRKAMHSPGVPTPQPADSTSK